MADRFGTSREKTYRSRNRAIAALVQSSSNVVATDIDGLDSAAVISLINATGGTDSATVITLIEAANDSDRDAGTQTQVFRMSSTSELSTLSQHNGLGSEIGTVKVGDIAYTTNPLKAFVLTNIPGPSSGYTNSGFRMQQGNGTVTRAHFDIVPAGQLPSQNFAVGMQGSRATYAADVRTITAVSDTGGTYGKGYVDFTPSMAGYAPPWDNKYLHVSIVPLTTWHRLSFDSSDITSIAGSAAGAGFDSAGITSLIDSSYINSRIGAGTIEAIVDSAYVSLRDRFQDSSGITAIVDSAYIQARQSNVGGGGLDSAATLALVNTQSQQTTFTYTTTSPTTTISGNDDNGVALSYTAGNVIVFQNGILLVDSADYTATGGSSINLGVATDSGDTISITKFTAGSGTGHSQFKYVSATPQTTFSGTATHGGTLTYDVGNIQVFVNGILLVDSQDYTATDGTSVVLTQATDSNDVVAISTFSGGGSSGGGGGSADSATILAVAGELKGGMFRINPQSLTINTTIDSNENAHCAGPISFDSGVVLTINGNLVIS